MLVLVIPAFAVSPCPVLNREPVKLVGTVISSNTEGAHYELRVPGPQYMPPIPGHPGPYPRGGDRYYVLIGPFDFAQYVGKTVVVKGYLHRGPSIWMKPVVYVTSIKLLNEDTDGTIDLTSPIRLKKTTITGIVTIKTLNLGPLKVRVYVLTNRDVDYLIIPVNVVPAENRLQSLQGYVLPFKIFGKNIFVYNFPSLTIRKTAE